MSGEPALGDGLKGALSSNGEVNYNALAIALCAALPQQALLLAVSCWKDSGGDFSLVQDPLAQAVATLNARGIKIPPFDNIKLLSEVSRAFL